MPSATPWLPRRHERAAGRTALLCFPYAGAGASIFREWPSESPSWLDPMPVEFPGRASRLRERPLSTVAELAETAAAALEPFCSAPYALFGHSLGALVAFELARILTTRGRLPIHLFVSGSRAPHVGLSQPPAHGLPLTELCDRLRAWGGAPEQILAEPELMTLLEPALRADLAAAERYEPPVAEPLPVPITAFAGLSDPLAPPDSVAEWSTYTSNRFSLKLSSGNHFFINSDRQMVLRAIVGELALSASQSAGGRKRD